MENNNQENETNKLKHFFNLIKIYIYQILYVISLIVIWIYIILNWNKCISMRFFDKFNGNNILFLFGIAWVVLFFYDVEAKDFKFHRRKYEIMDRQYQSAENIYHSTFTARVTNNENEEENSDEQTRSSNGN